MRSLVKTDKHELIIRDKIGGDLILFYRLPTFIERSKYENSIYLIKDGSLVLVPDTRINFGKEILTGIGENCFSDEDGAISSDPEKDNYREDWKDLLVESAPEIVAQLAFYVFENTKILDKKLATATPDTVEVKTDPEEQKKKPKDLEQR